MATLTDVVCQARQHFSEQEPQAAPDLSARLEEGIAEVVEKLHGLSELVSVRTAPELRRCSWCSELHVLAVEAKYDWLLWQDQRSK